MTANTTDQQRIAELPDLPEPMATFADHSYPAFRHDQMQSYALAAQDKATAPLIERIKELEHRQPIKLGVIEFHTPKNSELIRQFYEVTNDLKMAGCIVDLWLLDIATVLKKHGYSMEIYKDAATNQGGQQNG